MVKHLYYQATASTGQINQYHSFGGNQSQKKKEWIHLMLVIDKNFMDKLTYKYKTYYGEQIQPKSIQISDFSGTGTFDIRDDGYGNLYDFACIHHLMHVVQLVRLVMSFIHMESDNNGYWFI